MCLFGNFWVEVDCDHLTLFWGSWQLPDNRLLILFEDNRMVHVVDLTFTIDAVLDDRGEWAHQQIFSSIQILQLFRNVTNRSEESTYFRIFDAFDTFEYFLVNVFWVLREDQLDFLWFDFIGWEHLAATTHLAPYIACLIEVHKLALQSVHKLRLLV